MWDVKRDVRGHERSLGAPGLLGRLPGIEGRTSRLRSSSTFG